MGKIVNAEDVEDVNDAIGSCKVCIVDFTAKWCLTCQTNKAATYTAATRKFFYDNGIVTLKADMTKKNLAATKAIHALDRSAIPVNVLYVPNDQSSYVTREVLTPDYLVDFIQARLKK